MSHLVRWDAKKGASFVHALRLDVDRETTSRVGHAYGIIVADVPGRQGEALAAHLEDAFTRGAAEAVRRLSADAPQDQLFEAAIARANHALNRLFGENGLGIEPERISAAIVALKGHDLVAATWGAPSMLLFHPMPNGSNRIFDMADDGSAESAPYRTSGTRRCFGSIISGRMGKRDRLLIASQDLRMYLGDEALASAVVGHEPAEATSVLNRLLSPRDESLSVALLVLDIAEIRYVEHDPSVAGRRAAPTKASASSIAKLLQTASDTGETMTPSLMGGIGGLTKKMSGLLRRKEEVSEEAEPVDNVEPSYLPEREPIRAVAPEPKSIATPVAPEEQSYVPELPASLRQNVTPAVPLSQADFMAAVRPEPAPAPTPVEYVESMYDEPIEQVDEGIRTLSPSAAAAARRDDGDKTIVGTALAMAGALLMGLAKLSFAILRGTGSLLLSLFSAEKRRAKFASMRNGVDNFITGWIDRFNALRPLSKGLLLVALLLTLVAKGGIIAAGARQAQDDLVAEKEQTLAAIQQKIDSAEASAIYHDEARAASLLTEATDAINALSTTIPEEMSKKDDMLRQIAQARNGLRREVEMGAGGILASIATMNGNTALAKMTVSEDRLWLASTDGQLFQVPLAGGTAEKAGDLPGAAVPAVLIADGKDAYAASADGKGIQFLASGKSMDIAANFGNGETVPADAELYNGRLYVLDAVHNRISRHLEQTKSYDAAQFYLKDGTDLTGSVSLAIDGVVWVLKKDGQILRIEKGLRESFSTGQADPAVTNAIRLRTTAESDLYVLEASPSRILRFDKKSGSMVAQYVSPDLEGATDFAIDAKGTTAYVTKGNQVLKFAMPAP